MIKTEYGGVKEILKHKNFSAIAVMVDDSEVQEVEGRKVVKAGTILGGKDGSLIKSNNKLAKVDNTATGEGVLLYDVDVTHGPKQASMVTRGDIDINKIEQPSEEAIQALEPRILFIG